MATVFPAGAAVARFYKKYLADEAMVMVHVPLSAKGRHLAKYAKKKVRRYRHRHMLGTVLVRVVFVGNSSNSHY